MLRCVLILDPAGGQLGALRPAFAAAVDQGWEVAVVSSSRALFDRLRERDRHHLVIVHADLGDGRRTGLKLISQIHRVDADAAVVVAAEAGDVRSTARAIEAGAVDLLLLGDRLDDRVATLLRKLRGLFEVLDRNRLLDELNADLRETIQSRFTMIGDSPQIRNLIDQIQRVARVPRPVLITGERGTGKELVARAIHVASGAASKPIVTVNCAAFNDALLESELFGHEKGAFTGADSVRHGKFEQADGGTLFLDEIGHMSLPFQQKILRVVEYGTFSRVGGSAELKNAARIIAATNCDLEAMMRKGEFLRDLYDRLAFEVLEVPPLRERSGDVEVLARHFLNQFAREIPAFKGKVLARSAILTLNRYRFQGNVRELKNIIERAAYRDTTNEITPEDIGMLRNEDVGTHGGSFHDKVEAFRERLVVDAMAQARGNQAAAARDLGLSYHQFRYHLKKYVP